MKFLKDNGYKMWTTEKTDFDGHVEKWQRRVDLADDFQYPLCQCNDKLHININFYSYQLNSQIKHESYEIFIVGENNDSDWYDIKIYGIKADELVDNLKKYETKLLNMWEASNKEI